MTAISESDRQAQPIIGVFEGGGVKGIALAGAAAAAMDCGYRFERIVGTSAGAMVGALIQAGYGARELQKAVCELDWPGLLDRHSIARIPGIGKHLAVFFQLGVHRGDELERTWSELLARRGVVTFSDLSGLLRIVATDLTHSRGVVFPDDFARYGLPHDTPVAHAVRMSASVPFLFTPVRLRMERHEVLVSDGAMAANFPERVVDLDSPLPAIGFRFADPTEHGEHLFVRGPISFAAAVMRSGVGARNGLPVRRSRLTDTIAVPVEADSFDFELTPEGASELFDIGYRAARPQFEGLRRRRMQDV